MTDTPTAPQPITAEGVDCFLCHQHAETGLLISMVHGNSGPGLSLYAHEQCASARSLRPITTDPRSGIPLRPPRP